MIAPRLGRRAARAGKMLLGALLAAGAAASLPAAAEPAFSTAMATGGLTSQPIGHYEFCQANPAECGVRNADTSPLRLSDVLWRRIARINIAVNRAIEPMNDLDIYGRDEVWAYPDAKKGDCEDYVLAKRRALGDAGIPLSDLLITVVKKPDGEGHAVLTVRTDEGDFILDNLNDAIRPWAKTGYNFLKRQSAENTGRWVSIRKGQTPMVAAVQSVR